MDATKLIDEPAEDLEALGGSNAGSAVPLDSVTLSRLMEEVRNSAIETTAYNRTHNRHNRT